MQLVTVAWQIKGRIMQLVTVMWQIKGNINKDYCSAQRTGDLLVYDMGVLCMDNTTQQYKQSPLLPSWVYRHLVMSGDFCFLAKPMHCITSFKTIINNHVAPSTWNQLFYSVQRSQSPQTTLPCSDTAALQLLALPSWLAPFPLLCTKCVVRVCAMYVLSDSRYSSWQNPLKIGRAVSTIPHWGLQRGKTSRWKTKWF